MASTGVGGPTLPIPKDQNVRKVGQKMSDARAIVLAALFGILAAIVVVLGGTILFLP